MCDGRRSRRGRGGFTAVALARRAAREFSVEIDPGRRDDARHNAEVAGVARRIAFIRSDVFEVDIGSLAPRIDAAFLDPDWADSGPSREYRFVGSTTRPPSDRLLAHVMRHTTDLTLVQPRSSGCTSGPERKARPARLERATHSLEVP